MLPDCHDGEEAPLSNLQGFEVNAQRATETWMCRGREGRRKERKTLTRCQTGPLDLCT